MFSGMNMTINVNLYFFYTNIVVIWIDWKPISIKSNAIATITLGRRLLTKSKSA